MIVNFLLTFLQKKYYFKMSVIKTGDRINGSIDMKKIYALLVQIVQLYNIRNAV